MHRFDPAPIRLILDGRGMTVAELAWRAGYHPETVRQVLKAPLSWVWADRLVVALGLHPNDVYAGEWWPEGRAEAAFAALREAMA